MVELIIVLALSILIMLAIAASLPSICSSSQIPQTPQTQSALDSLYENRNKSVADMRVKDLPLDSPIGQPSLDDALTGWFNDYLWGRLYDLEHGWEDYNSLLFTLQNSRELEKFIDGRYYKKAMRRAHLRGKNLHRRRYYYGLTDVQEYA